MTASVSVSEARPLRALTLHQPWAHAVAHLGKNVENRTRRTNWRGLVLIHAGSRVDHDALRTMPADLATTMPGKAVVAVARITDAHPDCHGKCSTWAQPGAWHWQLADAVALTAPVPAAGAQGLWIPDTALRRRVAQALPARLAQLL